MESLKKKKRIKQTLETKSSLSQIKNTVENHSNSLEQVEDRISGLKDKTDIKEKNRRIFRED
jgi:hypothetical protein